MEKGRLTIGLPIYNEEKTLRKTLDSIISNLDDVDLVIISDNHSTDATQTICREYCKKYDKIRYRRNLVNIGAWQNMAKLLEEVNTEFYMQLGGHDFLEPGCIALLKGGMTDNVVCCFGRTENQIKDMVIKDNYIEYKEELLSNVPGKRFVTYLLADMVNEPYFGIMRTKIFKEAIAKYGNYRGLSVDVLVVAYMTLGGGAPVYTRGKGYYIDTTGGEYMQEIFPLQKSWNGGTIYKSKEDFLPLYYGIDVQ